MESKNGVAIKELREALGGLSQERFAHELGTSTRTVSRYESGNEPSVENLTRLIGLADRAARADLKNYFSGLKAKAISASVQGLLSHGSARRIPYSELKGVADDIWAIREAFEDLSPSIPNVEAAEELKVEINTKLKRVLDWLYPWLSTDEKYITAHERRSRQQ